MILLNILIILIITLLIAIFISFSVYTFASAGPWVKTSKKDLDQLFSVMGAANGRKIIDLGSGEGYVVFEAAKTGFDVSGIEINPVLFLASLIRKLISSAKIKLTTHFYYGNLWNFSLADYDIVICYVFPEIRLKIQDKFHQETKKGSKLVFLKKNKAFEILENI